MPCDSYHKTWLRMLQHSVVALVPVGYAMPSFLLYAPRPTLAGAGVEGGTPGFKYRYDQMGAKIKTLNILRPFSKTPKISRPNIDPQKTLCRISETQALPRIFRLLLLAPKNPGIKNFKPKKSFDHLHHLKICDL